MRTIFLTTSVVFLCFAQLTHAQLYSPVENPETPNVFATQFVPLDGYETCDGPGESAYRVNLQAENFHFILGANDRSERLYFADGAPSYTQTDQFICSRIQRKGVEATLIEVPCGDEPPRPQSPLNELKANFSAELTICQSLGSFQVLDSQWTIEAASEIAEERFENQIASPADLSRWDEPPSVDISFAYYNFDQSTPDFGARDFSAFDSAAPSNNMSNTGYFHVNLTCIPIETPANVISVENGKPLDFFMKAAMNFTLQSEEISECNATDCVEYGLSNSRPTFGRCVSSE